MARAPLTSLMLASAPQLSSSRRSAQRALLESCSAAVLAFLLKRAARWHHASRQPIRGLHLSARCKIREHLEPPSGEERRGRALPLVQQGGEKGEGHG